MMRRLALAVVLALTGGLSSGQDRPARPVVEFHPVSETRLLTDCSNGAPLLVQRVSLAAVLDMRGMLLEVGPYVEARQDFGSGDKPSRWDIGLAAKARPWGPLVCGLAVNSARTKKADQQERQFVRLSPHNRSSQEIVASLGVDTPLPFKIASRPISLFGGDTWAYDVELDKGSRNILNAGLAVSITDRVSTGVEWEHDDVIHGEDTDFVGVFLRARF